MAITLDATQLETVLDALYDGGEYRWAAPVGCHRCNGQVLCGDHEADVRKGIQYANLARQLCKAAPAPIEIIPLEPKATGYA